jgi:hypothetical protein
MKEYPTKDKGNLEIGAIILSLYPLDRRMSSRVELITAQIGGPPPFP